jgi:hypothetical protein
MIQIILVSIRIWKTLDLNYGSPAKIFISENVQGKKMYRYLEADIKVDI